MELDQQRDDLKNKAAALEKDRDMAIKLAEIDKKQLEELALVEGIHPRLIRNDVQRLQRGI